MNIGIGDAIRLHNDAKVNRRLQGLLALVTEVRSWGVLADIPVPGGVCPVRVEFCDFTVEDVRTRYWEA